MMLNPRPIRAIRTRHLGYTNTKPCRILASTDTGHKLYIGTTNFNEYEDAHYTAAQALANKLRWGKFQAVGVFNGDYYWVLDNKSGI